MPQRSASLAVVAGTCVDTSPGTLCADRATCLLDCATRRAYILSVKAATFSTAQRECSGLSFPTGGSGKAKPGYPVAYQSYDEQLIVERYFGSRSAGGPLPSYWLGLTINDGTW
jgi:hypothetical protein